MKNIAIIGGHGFIGKNFCEFFLKLGYNISLIGRNSGNQIFSESVCSFSVPMEDTEGLLKAVGKAEVVIWLASSLIPGSHESSLELDFNSNVKPIIGFLERANHSCLNKFIYLSSGGTVYGDSKEHLPIDEDHKKVPISEYGLSKLITENYIEFITKSSSFESFVLRPSNVYGKYQNLKKPQGIIGFAFKSLIDKTSIDLYDNGQVIRDFVFVTDVAEAVLKCIDAPLKIATTHIFNVGNGQPFSIKDIVDKISKIAGSSVSTLSKSSRNFDCEYNVLSIEKIKIHLNWEPKIEVDQGLLEVWAWIKEINND